MSGNNGLQGPDQIDEDLGLCNPGIGIAYQDTLMHLHPEEKSSLESVELATYRFAWLDMMMRIHQKLEPDNDKTWLMKDPKHSAFLPQLIQQFPGARFIFIHRSPDDILASMAKLFLCFTCVSVIPGASGTTSAEWGQYALERTKFYSDGIVQYSKAHHMDENKASSKCRNGGGRYLTPCQVPHGPWRWPSAKPFPSWQWSAL